MIFVSVEFSVSLVNHSAHYFEQNLTAVAVFRGHISVPIPKFYLSINNSIFHQGLDNEMTNIMRDFEVLSFCWYVY